MMTMPRLETLYNKHMMMLCQKHNETFVKCVEKLYNYIERNIYPESDIQSSTSGADVVTVSPVYAYMFLTYCIETQCNIDMDSLTRYSTINVVKEYIDNVKYDDVISMLKNAVNVMNSFLRFNLPMVIALVEASSHDETIPLIVAFRIRGYHELNNVPINEIIRTICEEMLGLRLEKIITHVPDESAIKNASIIIEKFSKRVNRHVTPNHI